MADSRYAGEAGLQAVFGQIKAAMAEKQDKINDMGLSHNDYSDAEKQKNAQNASDIVALNSDIDNIIEKMDGDATTYTYADVITIPDAVPANLADCSVKIEPVQDLHGYDNPWVGGAGVNQYVGSPDCDDYTNIALWTKETATYNGNPVYSKSSSWDGLYKEISLPVGVHTFSFMCKGDETATNGGKVYLATNSTTAVVNTNEFTFTRTAEWQKFSFSFEVTQAGTVAPRVESMGPAKIYISEYQLEAGSTATTFAPYTNICPITGHTEASVQRDGRNLFDESAVTNGKVIVYNTGEITTNANYYTSDYISVTSGDKYTFSGICLIDSAEQWWYDKDKQPLQVASRNATKTAPNGAYYFRFSRAISEGYVGQIEKGQTATPYEPYQGKTYTIALGDTIYGGTVNFDSGVMTVDRASVVLSDMNWYYDSGNSRFAASISGMNYGDDRHQLFMPNYAFNSSGPWSLQDQEYTCSNENVYLKDASFAGDATAFKNSMDGLIGVYNLATPTTIQLTPQQIQLLKGTNTLTASTGDISVTVNGVSGAIGAVQEQVNDIAEDVSDHEERIEVVENGLLTKVGMKTVQDLNSANTTGVYFFAYNAQNVPSPHSGTVLTLTDVNGVIGMQIARVTTENTVYVRFCDNSTWTAWKQLAFTA